MGQMSRKEPQSVIDPLDKEWEVMARKQRAINARQEAELDRKYSTARKVERTAETAGDVMSAAETISATLAAVSQDFNDLKGARAVKRIGGPLGPALSATAAHNGYVADRGAGMPMDEAAIKNYGGFALGTGVGALGAGAGAVAGGGAKRNPAGALTGASILGYMGQKDGEWMAEGLARGLHDVRIGLTEGRKAFNRTMSGLNDPNYYFRHRAFP